MTEIKSASDEELAQLAKGSSGGLSKEQPQPVPKPYMAFDAGEVQQESGLPGIKFDFNYGARVTVPQGEYRVKFIDRKSCLTVYDAFWSPAAKNILWISGSKSTKKTS